MLLWKVSKFKIKSIPAINSIKIKMEMKPKDDINLILNVEN